jgi:LysR family transcriptional regulator, hypochlorite-specific transcription factor HypT
VLLSRQAEIALVYRLPGQDHPVSPAFVDSIVLGADRLVAVGQAALLEQDVLPYIA